MRQDRDELPRKGELIWARGWAMPYYAYPPQMTEDQAETKKRWAPPLREPDLLLSPSVEQAGRILRCIGSWRFERGPQRVVFLGTVVRYLGVYHSGFVRATWGGWEDVEPSLDYREPVRMWMVASLEGEGSVYEKPFPVIPQETRRDVQEE